MHHELKIWPQYYCRVEDGSKTFEIRNNDRGFQLGDTVTLNEWDPTILRDSGDYYSSPTEKPKGYTGKYLKFNVGYVLPIDATRVVFSLLPLEASND